MKNFLALVLPVFPLVLLPWTGELSAQVPHGQDRPPGPPLSPEEARARMTVPEGFEVEVFACEPMLVNPTAMTFDERGRVWVTESLEYPRREAGPGRDRIQVLEDTDGDGRADRSTVFAEGLNIPCGIAVGHGGVFVTNSPDILFLKDTDGDGRADHREVLLTGFGRHDTHELPNTLTWGPDGWLYGLNGVFNGAVVVHRGKEHRFDAALWRYHPRTRDFELFAEGTSNPWGLAFDARGNAFVSACVIDHLFHLAEGGYYHRQAGKYPPFTWKGESIVQHTHQKAAYCGLALYDAAVYPSRYRGRLFLGNIHGGCLNVDRLERRGSTYLAEPEADFLTAGDAWFMPVSIKLAPDGCFFVLDWYDRYHCYQDANRDPRGIDRLKGRLYRIAYRGSPRSGRFDLASAGNEALLERLGDANLWWRAEARRLLAERLSAGGGEELAGRLKEVLRAEGPSRTARLEALWTLVSAEDPGREPRHLDPAFHEELLGHPDPVFRAWAVRAAGNSGRVAPAVRGRVRALARDSRPEVRLQAATAGRKLFPPEEAIELLLEAAAASPGDELIPRIAWRRLEPLLEEHAGRFVSWIAERRDRELPGLVPLVGRGAERLLARPHRDGGGADLAPLSGLAANLLSRRRDVEGARAARECLEALERAVLAGGLGGEARERLRAALSPSLRQVLDAGERDTLHALALNLAAALRDGEVLEAARRAVLDRAQPAPRRAASFRALLTGADPDILATAQGLLAGASEPEELLREVLLGLGRLEDPAVAPAILGALSSLPPALRGAALDVLTGRKTWSAALLEALEAGRVERSLLNVNHMRKVLAGGDPALRERVARLWGQVRAERDPEKEKLIARVRRAVEARPGDPWKGKAVFEKTCSQCHVLFGKGQKVGPDLTLNGRETLDALLSNLLDPNLVIGKDYYAWTLVDRSSRVLSGLLVEDSPQRVVLRLAAGKEEAVPREDIETLQVSEVSLMPEDLERTHSEEELRDLVAYLRYEEPPPEPVEVARREGGAGEERLLRVRQSYGRLVVEARPGGSPPGGAGGELSPLLVYHHSGDGRPYLHPLQAPGGGPVLTSAGQDPEPWRTGVYTFHARAGASGEGTGWIRSRGLERVEEHPGRIDFLSRSDWLTARRAGRTLLEERQAVTVHAPDARGRARIDIEWTLLSREEVALGESGQAGLAAALALHRRGETAGRAQAGALGASGRFGERGQEAGLLLLDHPGNAGYPSLSLEEGLLQAGLTARGSPGERSRLVLKPGAPLTLRYRLVAHTGRLTTAEVEEEIRAWSGGAGR